MPNSGGREGQAYPERGKGESEYFGRVLMTPASWISREYNRREILDPSRPKYVCEYYTTFAINKVTLPHSGLPCLLYFLNKK